LLLSRLYQMFFYLYTHGPAYSGFIGAIARETVSTILEKLSVIPSL